MSENVAFDFAKDVHLLVQGLFVMDGSVLFVRLILQKPSKKAIVHREVVRVRFFGTTKRTPTFSSTCPSPLGGAGLFQELRREVHILWRNEPDTQFFQYAFPVDCLE